MNAVRRVVVDPVSDRFRRARARILDDLRIDPYLPYILVLALVLAGFWSWHRVPNFATRDERWRVVDPFETLGYVAADPGLDSLREGVAYWRTYGATMYLFGVTGLPVVAYLFVTGRLDVATATTDAWGSGVWAHWLDLPGWFWTATLLAGRLANVAFAVGCVYVVYRIGTVMNGRRAGRLAALLLSLTWGFLVLAHEVGEDVPALFFLLVAVYAALRYVDTGRAGWFYGGSLAGGVAMGFKLTAGVAVPLLGLAYLLRARRPESTVRAALARPRLLLVGGACGAAAVVVGYPGVLLGGLEVLGSRVARAASAKSSLHGYVAAPSWWWLLRGTAHAAGLPLLVALLATVPAALLRVRDRTTAGDGVALVLAALVVYRLVYSLWAYVRPHHLLPVVALLAVALATLLADWLDRRPALARPAVALLVLTTALYAGAGVAGYASQPRDQATRWLATHAGANDTIETYVTDPQEAAVPHGATVDRPTQRAMTVDGETVRPSRTRWMLAMPERCPAFIVLNAHESLQYLAPDDYSRRAALLADSERKRYVRRLLAEDTYPYEVARRFGREPRFLTAERVRTTLGNALRAGLVPRSVQYGDGQDMGEDQYTVVLERTGRCNPDERSPL
jgi:hypothetical protein